MIGKSSITNRSPLSFALPTPFKFLKHVFGSTDLRLMSIKVSFLAEIETIILVSSRPVAFDTPLTIPLRVTPSIAFIMSD